MKRKAIISCYGVRWILCLLWTIAAQALSAQEENTAIARDSMRMTIGQGNTLFSPLNVTASGGILPPPSLPPERPSSLPDFSPQASLHLPYHTNPSPLFRGDYSTSGVLGQFSHGTLSASGSQTSLPGIGRLNQASLGYQHVFSPKLSIQLGVDATKINMMHTAGQTFSTSGILFYHASDRISFKVFGAYAPSSSYGINTHRYGASMSLDMTKRFGMEVGVQRCYNPMTGRWETVPIAAPYYNFDKFKLGLDVGGIVYELLRNVAFPNKMNSGGPTIAPPRFQHPVLR